MEHQKSPAPRAKKKRCKQKRLEYATGGRTVRRMENGVRTLNIAIVNPDSMKGAQMQRGVIKNIAGGKIHISEVRETHITKERNYFL